MAIPYMINENPADDPYRRIPLYGQPGRPITMEGVAGGAQTIYTQPGMNGVNVPVASAPGIPDETAMYQRVAQEVEAQNPYARPVEVLRGANLTREYPVSQQNAPLPPGQKYRFISNEAAAASGLGDELNGYYDMLRGQGWQPKEAMTYVLGVKEKRNEFEQKLQLEREKATQKASGAGTGQVKYAGEYINADTGERILAGISGTGVINVVTGEPLQGNWHRLGSQIQQPSAGERTSLAAFNVLKQKANEIDQMFTADKGLVGGGGITGIAGQYFSPDTAYFRSTVDDLKDSLLRARSGAQINEQEYQRLSKFLPSYYGTDAKFEGQLRRFKNEVDTVLNEKQKVLQQNAVGLPSYIGGQQNVGASNAMNIDGYTVEVE